MSVVGYHNIISGSLNNYIMLSQRIGHEVAQQAELVKTAFDTQLDYISLADQIAKPIAEEERNLLEPTSTAICAIQNFRERNRNSKYILHLSAVSESIPALAWVCTTTSPESYIRDMINISQFFTNRVLKDYNRESVHFEWARSWVRTLTELQSYVKYNHASGMLWADQYMNSIAAEMNCPPAIRIPFTSPYDMAVAPPPTRNPSPMQSPLASPLPSPERITELNLTPPIKPITITYDQASMPRKKHTVFSEINNKAAPTNWGKHLRRVVADIHAQPGQQISGLSNMPNMSSSAGSPSGDGNHVDISSQTSTTVSNITSQARSMTSTVATRCKAAASSPAGDAANMSVPTFKREGRKWFIEYQKNNKHLSIEHTDVSSVICMKKCINSTLTIKGKVNSIIVTNCRRCNILFNTVVSHIDFINCEMMQMQVLGTIQTINIEKSNGVEMILNKQSSGAEILSSISSEMRVKIPANGGGYTEVMLPEQLRTTFYGKTLKTVCVENLG